MCTIQLVNRISVGVGNFYYKNTTDQIIFQNMGNIKLSDEGIGLYCFSIIVL